MNEVALWQMFQVQIPEILKPTSLNSTTPVIVLPNVTFALDSRVIALLQCTYYIDNINSLKIIETRILEPGVVMQ